MKTEKRMASLMFADIVGYSKMMGMDQAKMLAVLDECKVIIEPLVELFNGKIIKWTGDEIFCEFPLNEHAADCALAIQTKLSEYNKDNKGFKVIMRIGIHSGEVAISTGDRHGNTVNVASRIEKHSPEGGVAVSGNVYSELKSYPRFTIEKMKTKKLKNIDFKYDLYRIKTGYEEKEEKKSGKFSMLIMVSFAIIAIGYWAVNSFFSGTPFPLNDTNVGKIGNKLQSKYDIDAKTLSFFKEITEKSEFRSIIDFLQTEQKKGRLAFGNKDDFHSVNNKCIIVLSDHLLKTVVFSTDNLFIDLKSNNQISNINTSFIGNRLIWVELF